MLRSRNKLFSSGRNKSSSLLTLNEIDEIEKKFDWRKNYFVNPKEIGRGHFSKVYQITCENRKQILAAKIIRRRKGGIDRLEKIRKEAEIIRRLNEKKIISVIQLFETHESFSEVVLISEFAKGGSLFNLMQEFNKGLDQNYVKCVTFKLLKALESMHLDNIVHLDIKADNILLREHYPSSNIAICDFGLATELKKGISYKDLVGTPDYMAPEIINYEKITFNADMWSVGVLIYFLLSGISPFMGPSKDETLMNVSKVRILFDSVFIDSEYSIVKNLISSLCVKSPNLRLSSSAALCHKWFEDILTLNLDYLLADTKIESIPMKLNINQTISPKLNNSGVDSQSNDNLNNYNCDELLKTQRCQSADLDCIDLNSKYKLLNTQPHSLFSAVSCDNIFIDENDIDKDAIDSSYLDEIANNNHTSANKRKSLHQLSHVDEVADETSYDCNEDIDVKGILNYGKIETGDSNLEISNKKIEVNPNISEKSHLWEQILIQITENSHRINGTNIKSNLVEKETVEFSKCRESENTELENDTDDKLKLSQIPITVSLETQQTVNERKKETGDSNLEISNKKIEVNPNISEKLHLSEQILIQVTENSHRINGTNIKSNLVEKETVEFSKCRESENTEIENDTDNKLKLSQIQITVSHDTQQTVNERKKENSTSSTNTKIPNTNLYIDLLDEYDNISDNCDEKYKNTGKKPLYSSSSDMDEEDDYRYTSLTKHLRFSELCKLL